MLNYIRISFILFISFIGSINKLQAQIELVKDVNEAYSFGTYFYDKIAYNGNIYILGKLEPNYDTTLHLFKYNLATQEFSSCFDVTSVLPPQFAFVYNNFLYYFTTDASQNWSLWKTDGTAANNQLLAANLKNMGTTSYGFYPVEYNGKLYFMGNDAVYGPELWVTDGSVSGTHIVKDINSGTGGGTPKFLTLYNDKIYFNASDGISGAELWMSDGTSSGTTLVKDIFTGALSSEPSRITVINGNLVFSAGNLTEGTELWVSDGSSAGTTLLKDISPGPNASNPMDFYYLNNKLYFAADSNFTRKIYETDGTVAGTKSWFNPTPGNSIIKNLYPFNNQLLYVANTTANGDELWRTDGTSTGTYLVKNIAPSIYSSNPNIFVNDTLSNGLIISANNDSTTSNVELWFTDGTSIGTYLIKDINNLPTGTSMNGNRLLINNKIYFEANDISHGMELYVTDGTNAGTNLLIDAETGTPNCGTFLSINGGSMFNYQNNCFFRANSSNIGTELWVTNGTTSGTQLVEDISVGTTSTNYRYIDTLNGELYIFIKTAQYDEIRKINSGLNGTTLIKSIVPVMNYYTPIKFNNKFYFNGTQAPQVSVNMPSNTWVSDGTTAGTVALLPFIMKSSIVYNNNILFYGMDSTQDSELWISDGTISGTHLVKNINSNTNSDITNFTSYNGLIYFIANDAINGEGLWKTDGTTAGTVLVKDLNAQMSSAGVLGMKVCGNKIFVMLNYAPTGSTKLWVSDGTTAGTNFVSSTIPGFDFTTFQSTDPFFYEYNGKACFWLYNYLNPSSNDGFWISDGTTTGTYLLKYGLFGDGNIVTANNILYFGMGDTVTGIELYRSDGTPSGTYMIQDKIPGKFGFTPSNLTLLNGGLLMRGSGRETGLELYSYCAENNGIASASGSSIQRLKACNGIYNVTPCEKICEVTNTNTFDPDVIKAQVWIDNLLGSNYVSRRYELKNNPTEFNNTGSITLYFKQSEFDSYNSQSNYYVPLDSLDTQNYKSNIVVAHYADTSVGETGLITSYNASTLSIIDPTDSNITWNTNLHCWEITFDFTQGYGGFFIKGLNPLTASSSLWSLPKVYPNPMSTICLVDVGNNPSIHDATLFDMLGKPIKQFTLHSKLNQLNLECLQPGMYILKVGTTFYTKLVKQ